MKTTKKNPIFKYKKHLLMKTTTKPNKRAIQCLHDAKIQKAEVNISSVFSII